MNNNNQTDFAGFWIRWFAEAVDIIVWSPNFFVPLFLLSAFGSSGVETFIPSFLWFLLYVILCTGILKLLIRPLLISKIGAGFGKLACGLQITRLDGSLLTYKNALFREYIAKIASNALLGLGYYWIFKNPQKQAWHDSLAGTYVIKKHNGFFAGLMVLILFLVIDGGLAYKAFENFKNNLTLQYDMATLVTQIQQDLNKNIKPKSVPSSNNVINPEVESY